MASTNCGYCGRFTHMTLVARDVVPKTVGPFHLKNGAGTIPASTTYTAQGTYTCDNCRRMSVAFGEVPTNLSPSSIEDALDHLNLTWHPLKVNASNFPDVPDHISRAAVEAHTASVVDAPMAAILMARTVVEATAKDRGITKGLLFAKIDELAKQGFIRTSTQEAAHEIRHFGNDMAHGDIEVTPDADDVADVLSLMDEVLNEVFQGPARTAKVKARRQSPDAAEAAR